MAGRSWGRSRRRHGRDDRSCSNWRHRAVERKLKARGRSGARCALTLGKNRGGAKPARALDGERRTASLQEVRRGLATCRRHENVKRELWRLRKSSEKIGKLLTVTKRVAAAHWLRLGSRRCFSTKTTRRLVLGLGRGLRRSGGRYLKPPRRARQASHGDRVWPVRNLHRVQLGYEVGDGSDRWAPPSSDTGRGPALSVTAAERRARGSLGCSAWAGETS